MKFLQGIGKLFFGVIGLIVVIAVLAVACSGGKDKASVKTQDGKTEKAEFAKLGDTVNVGDWEYTFTNAKTAKTVKGLFNKQEKPDHDQFIVVDVEVKNVGKDKCTLSDNFFKLKDKEGNEYDSSNKIHNDFLIKPLNPKGKAKGTIAFEVPEGKVGEFELVATGGFSSRSEIAVKIG